MYIYTLVKISTSHIYMVMSKCYIAMNNYTYTYTYRNIFNTIRVRKGYEGYYCVRGELETEQNCNILTPNHMAITTFLSRSPGLLN